MAVPDGDTEARASAAYLNLAMMEFTELHTAMRFAPHRVMGLSAPHAATDFASHTVTELSTP
jgi:hypothetical protein